MNILRRSCQRKGLTYASTRKISALTVLRPSFIVGKIKQQLTSRAGLFRLMLVGSCVHLVATFSGSILLNRQVTMGISDYMDNQLLRESDVVTIYGILKVGSVKVKRGTQEIKFTLTDHKHSLDFYYKGHLKFEFKEGETIVVTGYCPDRSKPQQLVCVDYQTKHAMEVNDWQDSSNKSRKAFGLK